MGKPIVTRDVSASFSSYDKAPVVVVLTEILIKISKIVETHRWELSVQKNPTHLHEHVGFGERFVLTCARIRLSHHDDNRLVRLE